MVDHEPAIGLVVRLPGRISAVTRTGLLLGPSHKQADAHPVKEPQDFHGVTLQEIAENPHGFILRQGWASLDFSELELRKLRKLYETLQLEIINVLESLNRLRESPDYELCQLSEIKPGVLEELASARAKLLEKESTELEEQARRLGEEIKELSGEASGRIA